jgi:hypothetical protein
MSERTMFLRDKSGNPVGCLAIVAFPDSNVVEYQFSVVNLDQDDFDREVARGLALGRLVEMPITVRLPARKFNMFDISRAVMKNLTRREGVPSRAIKAAKLWLKQNENKA